MMAALNSDLEAGDMNRIMGTLGEMARSHGMGRVAQETGLGRESLYKSMRASASPEFATVLKVIRALGLRFHAHPALNGDEANRLFALSAVAATHQKGWQPMDEAKVNRDLAIIGKQTFVTYFELLSDAELPDNEVADLIASELGCTFENAMSWRVKPARTLIRAGQAYTALLIISRSNRLPSHITRRASDLGDGISSPFIEQR